MTYDERLTVPVWWWPVAAVLVGLLGAEFHAGFGWVVAVVTDTFLVIVTVSFIHWISRIRVRVEANALVAGRDLLALGRVTEVRVLDREAWRYRLGPGSDVRAHLVTRPWVHTGIEVDVDDPEQPYWLVSSRRPDELAEAVRHACGAPSQHGSM